MRSPLLALRNPLQPFSGDVETGELSLVCIEQWFVTFGHARVLSDLGDVVGLRQAVIDAQMGAAGHLRQRS
jgi:hypothetical protein